VSGSNVNIEAMGIDWPASDSAGVRCTSFHGLAYRSVQMAQIEFVMDSKNDLLCLKMRYCIIFYVCLLMFFFFVMTRCWYALDGS
jgi:hypothetical protein